MSGLEQEWTTVSYKKEPRIKPHSAVKIEKPKVKEPTPWYEPESIVINKPAKKTKVVTKTSVSNSRPNSGSGHVNAQKIEDIVDSDQSLTLKRFPSEFSNKLKSIRKTHNLKRLDLANKLNVKESLIASIENGTETYDQTLANKINNQLQRLKLL